MNIFFLFLSFFSFSLFADVEEHLKRIPNKSVALQIKNIDFIYMINLDQRPEKFERCLQELKPYHIIPYQFSAVNGWELTVENLNDLGVKYEIGMDSHLLGTSYLPENNFAPTHEIMHVEGRTYFCHEMRRGPIGIVLSHLSVLQDAYEAGYNTIWVMEDDIRVIRNPHLMSDYIEKLDSLVGDWDVLFTDRDTINKKGVTVPCLCIAQRPNFTPADSTVFAMRTEISPDFRKIGARYGAYSMIVRRSGMKKILDFFKKYQIFLPYDMDFFLAPDISIYTVLEDVVSTQQDALSDNGKPNYKNKNPL